MTPSISTTISNSLTPSGWFVKNNMNDKTTAKTTNKKRCFLSDKSTRLFRFMLYHLCYNTARVLLINHQFLLSFYFAIISVFKPVVSIKGFEPPTDAINTDSGFQDRRNKPSSANIPYSSFLFLYTFFCEIAISLYVFRYSTYT